MGRPEGSRSKVTREVFDVAFTRLGGVDRLVKWANEEDNMRHFYTIFAKTLPKEIRTEDLNRTHEQFIELMNTQAEQNKLKEGEPVALIEG